MLPAKARLVLGVFGWCRHESYNLTLTPRVQPEKPLGTPAEKGFRRAIRTHAWLALALALLFAATRGYYLADTLSYTHEVAAAAGGRAPAATLWEFGHLFWRPLGLAFLQSSLPYPLLRIGYSPAVLAAAFFIAVNWVCAVFTVLLWHSFALDIAKSRSAAFLTAFGFACASAFLTYSRSGSSYVPGLFCVTISLWLARRFGMWGVVASAAAAAAAALLWFPYILSAPGILFVALWPSPQPIRWSDAARPQQIRRAACFCGVLLVGLTIGFGAGAAAARVGSAAEAKAWVSGSSHGWAQTNRALRTLTGAPRSFLYMGKDGLLYKRFLRKDPFAPVAVLDLARASLWKIAAFDIFLLCLAWEALRGAARWLLLLLFTGAIPVLLFAILLFEPGSAERYFPAYPFLVFAVAWTLRDFRARRLPQYVTAAFLVCMAATNIASMNRASLDDADRKALTRIAPLGTRVHDGALIVIVNNQDDLSATCNRSPFAALNQPDPLRLYDVVEPSTARAPAWREEFAREALAAWAGGREVWVTKRLWASRPRPEWSWAEGDDPRVRWQDLPAFFRLLETDGDLGGEDGFYRLKSSQANAARLEAVAAYL